MPTVPHEYALKRDQHADTFNRAVTFIRTTAGVPTGAGLAHLLGWPLSPTILVNRALLNPEDQSYDRQAVTAASRGRGGVWPGRRLPRPTGVACRCPKVPGARGQPKRPRTGPAYGR
jgi:hypothetical protein